jgi:hypothetical protein
MSAIGMVVRAMAAPCGDAVLFGVLMGASESK